MKTPSYAFRLGLTVILVLALLPLPAEGLAPRQGAPAPAAPQALILVNSEGDEPDPYPADGLCDICADPSADPPVPPCGICTLQAAIQTISDGDTIQFATDVHKIWPETDLPVIEANNVTIDGLAGRTERVELAGNYGCVDGLILRGSGTVHGLVINSFMGGGLVLGVPGPYTVTANYIGLDAAGLFSMGNRTGIEVGGDNVTIGGDTAAERNVIAGNQNYEINVLGDNCTISGNYIGVDASGGFIPSAGTGIFVSWASGTIIGGTAPERRNVISCHEGVGIDLWHVENATIQGNYIGTDKDGLQSLGNRGGGIRGAEVSQSTIGGTEGTTPGGPCTGACNLISGNFSHGINLSGQGNTIQGNYIGTTVNGNAALGNSGDGVYLIAATDNTISDNLVSANQGNGIDLISLVDGSIVRGNRIGTNAAGTAALGNAGAGVVIGNGSDENVIGGDPDDPLPASCGDYCNLISANGAGISITVYGGTPGQNSVIGNFIGTDIGGTDGLGNQGHGVVIQRPKVNLSRNLISANEGDGVHLSFSAAYGPSYTSTVQANLIGTEVDGMNHLGNRGRGLFVYHSSWNHIGGTEEGQGNTIAFNAGAGLVISDTTPSSSGAVGNRILGNLIHSNDWIWWGIDGMGLDLNGDGVSENDEGDADTGPNRLQNFPVIAGVEGSVVSGTLDSAANTTFRLEFFASAGCSRSGHGQGEIFLGSLEATTDDSGHAAFRGALPIAPPAYARLTATATDPEGNTSEFSRCSGALLVNSVGDHWDELHGDGFCSTGQILPNGDPECTLRAAIEEANAFQGPDTILFDIPDVVGVPVIAPGSSLPNIGETVVINGATQPGGWVELNGSLSGGSDDGLDFWGELSGGSYVQSLVITEFAGDGITLDSDGNAVVGNLIGIRADGSCAGNGDNGILVSSDDNVIGGARAGEGNVIACNGGGGLVLSGDNNVVQGNRIGVDPSGALAAANLGDGIEVLGADNTIGGDTDLSPDACRGACNLIAGNGGHGVNVNGDWATGNQVLGNYIGTDEGGTVALPNGGAGVLLDGMPGNTVGAAGAGNLVSGNTGDGVKVAGAGATGNQVLGNYIGTDNSGTVAVPNGGAGVLLDGAPGNTVGAAGAGNLISGNAGSGVEISGEGADNNVVQDNAIGLNWNVTGNVPNGGDGILLGGGAADTQVGGADPGEGNVIGGNRSDGIEIAGPDTDGHIVQGNWIGTSPDGLTRLGNYANGVYIAGGAGGNTVGGVITPTANVIAFNGGDGVYVAMGSSNLIRHNLIYTNTGLGIDLGDNGVTPNDSWDEDGGANNLQNFPVLTSLVISGGVATIEGLFHSAADQTYTLDFYANDACDPSLHGEGRRFLGTITVTTPGDGNAGFVFTTPLSETDKVAATATDATGNTSEFGQCARPTERVVFDPAIGYTLVMTDAAGHRTMVEIAAGAVTYTQPITLAYALIDDPVGAPVGLLFAHHAFELSAYLGRTLLSGLRFSPPMTITIYYGDADLGGTPEDELTLLYWDGAAWSSDGLSVVERDLVDNYVRLTAAHLSDFALFGRGFSVYLPLVLRAYAP